MKRIYAILTALLFSIIIVTSGCSTTEESTSSETVQREVQEAVQESQNAEDTENIGSIEGSQENQPYITDLDGCTDIPPDDVPYVIVNNNIPQFSEEEITTESFETYSDLDNLGRCGTVTACIGTDLMPTEERGRIGDIKPTGWHAIKYDHVDGEYLFNRCHLIGYQLTAENANEKNLITGTRYMNTEGMLPFEELTAGYVKETGHHVMYRVTPYFEGKNLLANGVHMEALSVEDNGKGVRFNVFVYNIQPGINIDYATGESALGDESPDMDKDDSGNKTPVYSDEEKGTQDYILNISTKKFHNPDCESVSEMKDENKESFNGTRKWLIDNGYEPCGNCKP